MRQERDERWAYVVLALLAVAYVAYRFSGTIDPGSLAVRLPDLDLGKFGKNLPYLFAPLFWVLSEVIRRRKARSVREKWERTSRAEGFLRAEDGLKITFVEGGRGSMQGDVRLTRAALYLLDKSGRRDPMRFALSRSEGTEAVILGVSLREGSLPELRRVHVTVGASGGGSQLAFEFESHEGEAWRSSLKSVLGRSVMEEPGRDTPTETEPT